MALALLASTTRAPSKSTTTWDAYNCWSPNGLHPIANSKLLVAPQRLIPNRSPREPCTLRSALAPTGMQSP
jgi:hypothetical protein